MSSVKFLVSLSIAVLAVACAPRETHLTSTATFRVQPSTSTAAATIAPIQTRSPYTDWHTACVDIGGVSLPNLSGSGLIVVNHRTPSGVSSASVLGLDTGLQTPLAEGEEYIAAIGVSPDRQWVVYGLEPMHWQRLPDMIYLQNRIGVASADGSSRLEMELPPDTFRVSHWLDNERLFMSRGGGKTTPFTAILLNPFTGEEQELPPDFPDVYGPPWDGPAPSWENGIGDITYDRSLARAVYARFDYEESRNGYVLWDMEQKRALAFLRSPYLFQTPKWSPDGSRFILVTYGTSRAVQPLRPAFFAVSRDGISNQLTRWDPDHQGLNITNYSWSPDGSKVAFWYSRFDPFDERLAILDVETGAVSDTCIQGDFGGLGTQTEEFSGISQTPIWSPDGRLILVENRYAEHKSQLILVDPLRGVSAKIGEDMMPIGWLTDP